MKRIVIALGGNALGDNPKEQLKQINQAAPAMVEMIKLGYEIIISHGNGPQVGMLEKAINLAANLDSSIPHVQLPECTAMSQGYIGYHLQNALLRELRKQELLWQVATIITQVEVAADDPAFKSPTKPIGSFYSQEAAEKLGNENPAMVFKEDAGRGYRQLVASPKPIDIVESKSILNLLDNEFIVIACGGGGIPVIKRGEGDYEGAVAVIDKDMSSAKLAELVDADYLFILTAVDRVAIRFGQADQVDLDYLTVAHATAYAAQNEFAAGSMLPKVVAAIQFASSKPGRKAVIASLKNAPLVFSGESGTVISL
ncbi:carbamate kinase [Lactococcus piscium]|uniref:Carbamate kinase n=1 Tax=Pseudolactococcus paracarnosus TaxID=2749962 RepID=A0A7L4WEV1_9LACT|nr:carbamate kinase [Lactococcus paracarnosus]MCJ1993473.1 carbamate kinase [Lactococcus paracarnosus]QDJ28838.1 carbamate kinase [Lactococcus paracarnosus]SPC37456.1 amino acid (carbamate) kinase [Lactococcus piscium]